LVSWDGEKDLGDARRVHVKDFAPFRLTVQVLFLSIDITDGARPLFVGCVLLPAHNIRPW